MILLLISHNAIAQRVSVVIGESSDGSSGSSKGVLESPFGVDFDQAGNMYIVELSGGRVHLLDTSGRLRLLSGDGSKGYQGDGGPASEATFDGMHNVAVTPEGDLYIADSWNHCIRKIDGKTGVISTVAGTGKPGFGGDGGPAVEAQFDFLMCVSLDPENEHLYLADLKNRRIRSVDLATGMVRTVAGNGQKGVPVNGSVASDSPLVDPRAVAVDSQKNVYILERGGHALRVVRSDGTIHTVAGTGKPGVSDGPASSAQLNAPKHLAIDHDDNVVIADDQNRRIRIYRPKEHTLTTVLGEGVGDPKIKLKRPHGVCIHQDGSLYVVDTGNHRILRVQPDETLSP